MSKLVAFYGSPGSGKTTIALKTALTSYMAFNKGRIIFVSPDIVVPSVALLFPNYTPDDVHSLGDVIDKTDIGTDSILEKAITIKGMPNLVCLGFKAGEGRYSFPAPTEGKITGLFDSLSSIADLIIVDCSNDNDDMISKRALETADIAFRVISADPKGLSWYASNKHSARKEDSDLFNIVTAFEKDVFLAVEDVCKELNSLLAVMPYSKQIRQQMIDGCLYNFCKDKAYNRKLNSIILKISSTEE